MSRQLNIILIIIALLVSSIIIVGLFFLPVTDTDYSVETNDSIETDNDQSSISWMNIDLFDISSGSTFSINEFVGKPILLESFAVWCSTCLEQQKILDDLLEQEGDSIIHISINTDPNEDESRVRQHIEKYGFSWYFAISPIELTNALRDSFGLGIVNAPSAPIVLVCEDQSSRFLRNGIKSVEDLLSEIETGC